MATIKTLEELFDKLHPWFEENIPNARKQLDSEGRKWFLSILDWSQDLKESSLRKATDREQLNTDFRARYKEEDPQSKKGISAIKLEISQLYSFNKSLVLRHKSRLQCYRDDLSQKGARNMFNSWQSIAIFKEFKQNLDA
jgi:hypothetical protein